jgi:hypothetical protein
VSVPTPTFGTDARLEGVDSGVDTGVDTWAVGGMGFDGYGSQPISGQVPAILHWNGQAWQHVAAPSPGDSYSGVTAL